MKLSFNQEPGHIVEFYKFHYWYSPERRNYRIKHRALLGLAFFVLPFIFFHFSYSGEMNRDVFLNLLSAALLLGGFGIYFAKKEVISRVEKIANRLTDNKDNYDLIGPVTIQFKEDIIKFSTLNNESRMPYTGIRKVKQNLTYYFVYIKANTAWTIPKAAFLNVEEKQRFETLFQIPSSSKNF
jgi:hypothetical protein